MGVIISSREEVQAYFDSPRLNQSAGKALFHGLENYLSVISDDGEQDYYKEKGHFVKGSAVDMKLTGNGGDYESYHHISRIEKKPTDVLMKVAHKVMETVKEYAETEEVSLSAYLADNGNSLEDYQNELLSVCRDIGYQPNWKDETLIKNVTRDLDEYFKDILEADGKQVLSQEEAFLADDIVMSLTTNELTKRYFDREEQAKDPDLDVYYQKIIYFEYKGVECKAMLDIVIVHKKDGVPVAILPVDVKTMAGLTLDFDKALKIRRYDVQAAWYTLALLKEFGNAEDHSKDPSILPFRFIVESTTHVGNPLVYEMDNSLLFMGAFGRPELTYGNRGQQESTTFVIGRELKGYEHFVNDYLWYEQNGWEKDRRLSNIESGVLKLDWNGIMANDADRNRPVLHKQDVEIS